MLGKQRMECLFCNKLYLSYSFSRGEKEEFYWRLHYPGQMRVRIRLSYFPSKRRESKESYSSYLTYLAPKLSLSGLLNLELKSSFLFSLPIRIYQYLGSAFLPKIRSTFS